MTRPTRSTWQQHQHMRAITPVYPRHAKPARKPLTLARVAAYAVVMLAMVLVSPVLFVAATGGVA